MNAKLFNQVVIAVVALFAIAFSLRSGVSTAGNTTAPAATAVSIASEPAVFVRTGTAGNEYHSASGEGHFSAGGQLEGGK